MFAVPFQAHRAPDPLPVEEPSSDPFDEGDPHQAPVHTPQNEEDVPDPNPSIVH